MLPERYNTLTYGCILLSFAGMVKSACTGYYTADHTLNSIRASETNKQTCTYYIESSVRSTSSIYIRIYFPVYHPVLPYYICSNAYIDVYNGTRTNLEIIGRYCDMNSSLIHSTSGSITLKVRSHASFDYQIVYCLDPFYKPDPIVLFESPQTDSSLPPVVIASIAVGIFLATFILGCMVIKCCKRKPRGSNSDLERTAEPPDYNTLQARRPDTNSRSEASPPDNQHAVYVNPLNEPEPPPYWSVYANEAQAGGKTYPDTPPSYESATAHPS